MTRILARIGPKGQTVVPKPVRDELGLRPGDAVYFSTHAGHAHLEKAEAGMLLKDIFADTPKTHLPADIDFDAIYEESYDNEVP